MENQVKKSLEFKFLYDGITYSVQSFVLSTDAELTFDNVAKEMYDGFAYHLSFTTDPRLPLELARDSNMVYFIEDGGVTKLGYLRGSSFIECEDSIFISTLKARILELLMMPGDTGNYKE
ncbi:hypothetical protein [Flavobacterium johnsoniae]|jgi:hypothetical protein|uniref:Uncharacterized protein n=1 Tax=Flavobacterium johnsoniae TaxID=986 RepID=A0A1J7BSI2_FLAJO|nr:hypothetical protein [Flavobacterium johnsoniae]OIV41659.1 hypothetical protein BKM63_14135 [Flavobacterium johnsoniae]